MKITVMKPTEIECEAIRCVLPVEYDEEDMPKNFPFRHGDTWDVIIRLHDGYIRDWPDLAYKLHMKVVDGGCYYLLDDDGNTLASITQDYVPGFFPGQHYGDYIIFDIAFTGKITNWETPTGEEIADGFFRDDED